MLAPNVTIDDLDAAHIAGWRALLVPPALDPAGGIAVLVVDAGVPRRLAVAGRGVLPLDVVPADPLRQSSLAELRRALGVNIVVAVEHHAVAEIAAAVEAALRPSDRLPAQWLTVVAELRRRHKAGLWLEPRLFELVPPLSATALQRAFDLMFPDGRTVVAYCFDEGRGVAASFIGRKDGGEFTALTTHRAVEGAVPPDALAGDWRAAVPALLAAVDRRLGPPAIGVFFTRAAFHRIAAGPPDELARQLAAGGVVIEPTPGWLRALLGGAAALAAASQSAKVLSRFLPESTRRAAQEFAVAVQGRIQASAASPLAVLGFDPLALWREFKQFYRR